MIIAIDGPAGAGKSSVATLVARRLGWTCLSTGALYRGVAVKALRSHLQMPPTESDVKQMLHTLDLSLAAGEQNMRVIIDGEDITEQLYTPDVARVASQLAALPCVREWLLPTQQAFGKRTNVVTEGRDTTTVVFPDAEWKFYLDASPQERARRRVAQLRKAGKCASPQEIEAEIRKRDQRDRNREHAPLRIASDAVVIDTEGISARDVAKQIVRNVSSSTTISPISSNNPHREKNHSR